MLAAGAAGCGALLLYDSDSAETALFCFAGVVLGADRAGMMRGALPVAVAQIARDVLTVGRFAIYMGDGDGRQVLSLLPAFPLLLISGRGQLFPVVLPVGAFPPQVARLLPCRWRAGPSVFR